MITLSILSSLLELRTNILELGLSGVNPSTVNSEEESIQQFKEKKGRFWYEYLVLAH
jgi:hypothetical protein